MKNVTVQTEYIKNTSFGKPGKGPKPGEGQKNREETGLSIRYMLLAAVLIASLGAVMDVSVSMTASMAELKAVNPDLTARELFKSGMNIGKDIIGTMSNTLILAFAGSELDTLICLLAYGCHGNQLFSSDFFALEMAQGLCATSGVVLTVPITILVSIVFLRDFPVPSYFS